MNLLEIDGKQYILSGTGQLRQNELQLSNNYYDYTLFTLIKLGEKYLWTTEGEYGISVYYDGRKIGLYDSVGRFRVIEERLVLAASQGNKALIMIDGEEQLIHELPEVKSLESDKYDLGRGYNPNNLYVPRDFNGRIVFKAYEDEKYFIVEEIQEEPVMRPDGYIKNILTQ
jgi:hypothetical protein